MKPTTFTFALLAAVALLAAPALADWDEGDPYKMHFPQLPDLTPEGLDVLAGPSIFEPMFPPFEKFLADDWLCTDSGPVLDIHYWGSYNEDMWLMDPLQAFFSLVIFDNVPAGVDTSYSHPGEPLWSTYAQPTNARRYATAPELFYDPNQNLIVGQDNEVWQFNFEFDRSVTDVFFQQEGEVYWLGVHHTFDLNGDGVVTVDDFFTLQSNFPAAFGWKTADTHLYPPGFEGEHFMDDAVWTDVSSWLAASPHVVPAIPGPEWRELIHPFTGQSLDLSFVITIPEPASAALFFLGVLGAMVLVRKQV